MKANYKSKNNDQMSQVVQSVKISKKNIKDLNMKSSNTKKARSKSSHMRTK